METIPSTTNARCGLLAAAWLLLCLLPRAAEALTIGDTWQYATTKPDGNWMRDMTQTGPEWQIGRAGFGKAGTPGGKVNTAWETPEIWMRAEYVLPPGTEPDNLALEVCHNEAFEVFINGARAVAAKGAITEYRVFAIESKARQAWQAGKNVISVHCRQTAGGQFIDVGLTLKAPTPPIHESGMPTDDVDIGYRRKATWAETMRATRSAVNDTHLMPEIPLGSALATRFWRDFPRETDWLMQDSTGPIFDWLTGEIDGKADITNYLQANRPADLERQLIEKVIPECGDAAATLRQELAVLVDAASGPEDARWLDLYFRACKIRRCLRLTPLLEKTTRILFARHHNLGTGFFGYTEYTTWPGNIHGGLFSLDLNDEQTAQGAFPNPTALIKTDTGGILRDPEISYDGRRVLFAWRQDASDANYKIYEMDLATGKTRLITGGGETYGASYDPVYLPNGNILFNSSRVVQTVPCSGQDVSNLYLCDPDGNHARRVGFDQVHTLNPAVMDDGRVIYMRWDYNDRSQIFTQCLMQMNPDGTGQIEYYGNNTFEPTAFFHPRGIPGTAKVMVVLGGHHGPQCGKLAVVDNEMGRQGVAGVIELPSGKPPAYPRDNPYAQIGDQYCYPCPLDASSLLVSYDPIAYRFSRDRAKNKEFMRFHLYYMTFDGERELLAADARISSLQAMPVLARPLPHRRPSAVDYRQATGICFLEDVYAGPGLKGIPRGTIKKLRVVSLRYREMNVGVNRSFGKGGAAHVFTPVAVGTGTWDVKAILGDAMVYEDGSAMFEVPASTPIYFQALNARNQTVQTMRSWATLMPGETFSCVGCHEGKDQTPTNEPSLKQAMSVGPQKLEPFYGPTRGFSFPNEIQPILDKHCVRCHSPGSKSKGAGYDLTATPIRDDGAKRMWSRSYLTLTGAAPEGSGKIPPGTANAIVNWISNSSEPTMIPPQYGGSTRSKLVDFFGDGARPHAAGETPEPKLTREEQDKLCAWIDLVIPFCGDYVEANAWTPNELNNARQRIELRRDADERDLANIRAYLQAQTPSVSTK